VKQVMQKLAIDKKQLIMTLKHTNPKEIIVYTLDNKLGELIMDNKTFENDEEKLAFILKYCSLSNSEIASKFGVTQGTISKMKTDYNSTLKPAYLYAFESAYGIPYKIFEDKNIVTNHPV
jgi:DNA-directed RNA polymerase specialized sigma subunit